MKTAIFFTRNDFESAWQSASLALTHAALGDEVLCVFSFAALRGLSQGRFGATFENAESQTVAARAEVINAAHPQAMLQQSRKLGARFIACDTTVRLCGLDAEALVARGQLDAVEGLTTIVQASRESHTLTF